jgi:mono/diheme cytochrome c family protein
VHSVVWGAVALCLILLAGCQQEMANQPRYEPLEASPFFTDDRSSRHLVPGTVARGQLQLEEPLYTGRSAGAEVTDLPLPLSADLLARGRERYNIYCAPCHDHVGTGHGMIVRRGYPRPPSLHIPRLRQVPIGHFFVVMTNGYGAMPAYGSLVTAPDRWAIAAYLRALQLSQHAPVAELPAEMQQQLEK